MSSNLIKSLWSWWKNVRSGYGVIDVHEGDSIRCPQCDKIALPFASSTRGPIMRCSKCGNIFTARKF